MKPTKMDEHSGGISDDDVICITDYPPHLENDKFNATKDRNPHMENAKDRRINELEHQVRHLNDRFGEICSELDLAKFKISERDAEVRRLKQQMSKDNQKLSAVEKELAERKADLINLHDRWEQQGKYLREVEKKSKMNEPESVDRGTNERRYHELQIQRLQNENALLERDRLDLHHRLLSYDAGLKNERLIYDNQIHELQKSILAKDSEIASLKVEIAKQIEESKKSHEEWSVQNVTVALSTQPSPSENEIEEYSRELKAEHLDLLFRYQRLSDNFRKLQVDSYNVKRELEEKDRIISSHEARIQSMNNEKQGQLKELERANRELQKKNLGLNKQLMTINVQLKARGDDRVGKTAYGQKFKDLQSLCRNLQQRIQILKNQNAIIEEYEKKILQLTQENQSLKEKAEAKCDPSHSKYESEPKCITEHNSPLMEHIDPNFVEHKRSRVENVELLGNVASSSLRPMNQSN